VVECRCFEGGFVGPLVVEGGGPPGWALGCLVPAGSPADTAHRPRSCPLLTPLAYTAAATPGLACRAVHTMGSEFQKAADLLAGCLRQAADCLDQGADYATALGEWRHAAKVLLGGCGGWPGGFSAAQQMVC
jgi:hypothetical protein